MVIFGLEAFIKIVAQGFFVTAVRGKGRKAYLCDLWNVLDFLVEIISIVDVVTTLAMPKDVSPDIESQKTTIKGLRSLRILRSLRPLRMVTRFKGLKIAMSAIVSSLRQIFNVVAITGIVILIFAITGVHLFNGTFYHCVIDGDHAAAREDDRIDNKSDCLAYAELDDGVTYSWENAPENFDNLVNSMLNLMVFMTNEGWVAVMRDGIDSRGVDLQPKRGNSMWLLFFFITYMIVSHVFILNLFVGVIIEKFNRMHERLQGYTGLNTNERIWVDLQRLMMKQRPEKKRILPEVGAQRFLHWICFSKYFEGFIMIVIILNVVVLAMPYLGNSPEYIEVLNKIGYVFSAIYNMEAIIKIGGLRSRYFEDRWNQMDFFIVVTNDIGILLENFVKLQITDLVVVGRVLRVSRIFKIVRGNEGLMMLMNAISTLFS